MVSRRELSWNVRHTIRTSSESLDSLLNNAWGIHVPYRHMTVEGFCHSLRAPEDDFEPKMYK